MQSAKTVDDYVKSCPEQLQPTLQELRGVIKAAAPKAQEKISYGMPAYDYYGILVYFAAFKNHISLFPTAKGIDEFKEQLDDYQISNGTIRFSLAKPLPFELIESIIKFRVEQNEALNELKKEREKNRHKKN